MVEVIRAVQLDIQGGIDHQSLVVEECTHQIVAEGEDLKEDM